MRRAHGLVLATAVAVSLTACGRPAGHPDDLVGTWRNRTPGVVLELRGDSFRFQSGHLTKWGTATRTPFRVAFVLERTSSPAFDLHCRDTVDVYDWHLDDGRVTSGRWAARATGEPGRCW